jgi:hypothetical protein
MNYEEPGSQKVLNHVKAAACQDSGIGARQTSRSAQPEFKCSLAGPHCWQESLPGVPVPLECLPDIYQRVARRKAIRPQPGLAPVLQAPLDNYFCIALDAFGVLPLR